jgi:putative ABC transport system permease protein
MNLLETARIAMRGILANRLRSLLTMLGILIGVASVILLVAVGAGSSKAVRDQIARLGTNTITVLRGGRGGFGPAQNAAGTQSRQVNLTLKDVEDIRDKTLAPSVKAVAPTLNAQNVQAVFEGANFSPDRFIGTTENYPSISNLKVAAGRYFNADDVTERRRVVVVGQTVVTDLFLGENPVGKEVQLGSSKWTVIGTLTAQGSTGQLDGDNVIQAPYTSVQDSFTGRTAGLSGLTVQAKDNKSMDSAQAEVQSILNSNHAIASGQTAFRVLNQGALLSSSNETNRTLTVLLGAVAAISLLVGGIGVMNIMLVTVTERTREIGIRKAVGAHRSDILIQFLIEAVFLTMLGGLLGIAVGIGGSRFKIVGVQPEVQPYSVGLAFGFAVLIGLFFGSYPANRAAQLRPIDALRFE